MNSNTEQNLINELMTSLPLFDENDYAQTDTLPRSPVWKDVRQKNQQNIFSKHIEVIDDKTKHIIARLARNGKARGLKGFLEVGIVVLPTIRINFVSTQNKTHHAYIDHDQIMATTRINRKLTELHFASGPTFSLTKSFLGTYKVFQGNTEFARCKLTNAGCFFNQDYNANTQPLNVVYAFLLWLASYIA